MKLGIVIKEHNERLLQVPNHIFLSGVNEEC